MSSQVLAGLSVSLFFQASLSHPLISALPKMNGNKNAKYVLTTGINSILCKYGTVLFWDSYHNTTTDKNIFCNNKIDNNKIWILVICNVSGSKLVTDGQKQEKKRGGSMELIAFLGRGGTKKLSFSPPKK